MIKIFHIQGQRCESNPAPTPEGHWVGLVFENSHGRHVLELNGRAPLPDHDPALRSDLEFLLWDWGLLEQQDSTSDAQRVAIAQALCDRDRNHPLARAYLEALGAPA